MKRDLELIRKIILAIEDLPGACLNQELKLNGFDRHQIGYHCYLIIDSGLAKGEDVTYLEDTSPVWHIHHLTAAGHDFADSIRSDTTWIKTKTIIKDKGGSFTLEILKGVLSQVIKGSLGIG